MRIDSGVDAEAAVDVNVEGFVLKLVDSSIAVPSVDALNSSGSLAETVAGDVVRSVRVFLGSANSQGLSRSGLVEENGRCVKGEWQGANRLLPADPGVGAGFDRWRGSDRAEPKAVCPYSERSVRGKVTFSSSAGEDHVGCH